MITAIYGQLDYIVVEMGLYNAAAILPSLTNSMYVSVFDDVVSTN